MAQQQNNQLKMNTRFRKKNTTNDDYVKLGANEWSDNLGYLNTIDWLIRTAHEASVDDEDVLDWLMILEQLHIEIDGQLINKDEPDKNTKYQKDLENARIKARTELKEATKKQAELMDLRETIRPYHLLLNRLIHKHQLRMRNEGTSVGEMF